MLKTVFVPNVGWASQMASGEVCVYYNDGSQIVVKSVATNVKYIDPAGNVREYGQTDRLPDNVRDKLSQLSTIIEMFVTHK